MTEGHEKGEWNDDPLGDRNDAGLPLPDAHRQHPVELRVEDKELRPDGPGREEEKAVGHQQATANDRHERQVGQGVLPGDLRKVPDSAVVEGEEAAPKDEEDQPEANA